ncbi:MAG: BNR/Asp-box repeat domain protein, partial [Candidatus Moranbacteria bacterium GW2011_GWE2_36_40]
MALDVENENTILAGGVSGGMWRSTNSGQTWAKVTGDEQLHSVTCITQDTRAGKTNNWYYGTGEIYGNSAGESFTAFYFGDGIY